MRYSSVCALICATAVGTLPLLTAAKQPQFMEQSFYFDWNPTGTTVPIPIAEQCDTLSISWERSTATGPNPVAPYYLQIFTSTFIVPFIIDVGSGQDYDFDIPFVPNTQFQICMFDSNGNTGGCQAIYTVIPNSNSSSPSCNNVTFPAGALDVDGEVSTGPISEYGWIPQCTDIGVTPKNGTGPYTFEIAPSNHPPLNLTSDDMSMINWTVSLSYGSPFFITVGDADGNRWSQGPLHSGANDDTSCLDLNASDTPMVSQSKAIGAGVGGAIAGLVVGGLLAFLLMRFRARRHTKRGDFSSVSRYSLSDEAQAQFDENGRIVSPMVATATRPIHMGRTASDPFGMLSTSPPVSRYHVEPFVMPGEAATTTTAPSTSNPPENAGNAASGSSRQSATAPYGSDSGPSIQRETSQEPHSPSEGAAGSGSAVDRQGRSVYVVHHDGGGAPVTVYTEDGAEVVELPPRYMDDRAQGGSNPASRPRQPAATPRKVRGARTSSVNTTQ